MDMMGMDLYQGSLTDEKISKIIHKTRRSSSAHKIDLPPRKSSFGNLLDTPRRGSLTPMVLPTRRASFVQALSDFARGSLENVLERNSSNSSINENSNKGSVATTIGRILIIFM